jgi:hypothetical protein
MQGNAAPLIAENRQNVKKPVVSMQSHAAAPYQMVLDGRKRPIRGLRIRDSRWRARIAGEDFDIGHLKVRGQIFVGEAA